MMSRGSKLKTVVTALFLVGALSTSGCGVVFFGAAAGGGGYETHQHNRMQSLEKEYAAGKISQEDYEARKRQIQEASLLQR
jgi:uncharacterized membrane protein